jgi:HD-GYP domain-containing protein (c-di-GMP phosphodiesterase class II)
MFVSSFDLSWFKHPFVSTRLGVVRDQGLINELKRLGVSHVEIDTELSVQSKGQAVPTPLGSPGLGETPASPGRATHQVPPASDRERTARFARKLFDQAMVIAKNLMDGIPRGAAVKTDELRPLLTQLVESVNHNENVLHILISLKSFDDYTYTHCLNLSALGVLLGNSAGLDENEMLLVGMAGILHDTGKCLLPKDIIHKPGPLTTAEMEEVKRHPQLGHEYLSRQAEIPDSVLRAVLEHHERLDGKGYPGGLAGSAIHPFSSIISVVDIYDALTTDRVYRSRISPHQALRTLYNMRGQAFPEELVDLLIKRLGIFPAFSLVQLRNGCFACVTRQNPGKPMHPEVMVLCDRDKRPLSRRRVDTWKLCGELARKEFEIERPVENHELPAHMTNGLA